MIPATTIVVTTTLAPMIGWCLDATVGCSCASFWLGVERKMGKNRLDRRNWVMGVCVFVCPRKPDAVMFPFVCFACVSG